MHSERRDSASVAAAAWTPGGSAAAELPQMLIWSKNNVGLHFGDPELERAYSREISSKLIEQVKGEKAQLHVIIETQKQNFNY